MEAITLSYLLGLFRYNGEENGSYCYMIHKGYTPVFSEGTRPCASRYTEQELLSAKPQTATPVTHCTYGLVAWVSTSK